MDQVKLIEEAQAADETVRDLEARLVPARQRLYDAVCEAHKAGVPYRSLGRSLGVSASRIAQIVTGSRRA